MSVAISIYGNTPSKVAKIPLEPLKKNAKPLAYRLIGRLREFRSGICPQKECVHLPSGRWEYIIPRKGILPKPLSLTFDTEEEGDAYVKRLEQMLDAGILPEDLVARRSDLVCVDDARRPKSVNVDLS